jgi:DNA-binding sugar fermentation-stimulating protein
VAAIAFKGFFYAAGIIAVVDIVLMKRSTEFAISQHVDPDFARSFAAIAPSGALGFCQAHDTLSSFAVLKTGIGKRETRFLVRDWSIRIVH